MSKALYAFSGDPITFGHIDIIRRSAEVFDQVIVAIGDNPDKSYLFTKSERTDMAQHALWRFKNVQVTAFSGLLVDFAYEQGVDVIVKGVRSARDFSYEQNLYLLGESQKVGIDTFLLFAKPELQHVSSSAVKSLQIEQGFIQDYVPLYVKQCLENKLSKQYIVGITGEIGAGKSFLSQQLVAYAQKQGVIIHNIELDQLAAQIQTDITEQKYQHIRQNIVTTFGHQVLAADGSISRKALGEIVFADQAKLQQLNEIMRTAILVRLRRELKGKQGIILLNAALLAESEMLNLSNNNLILVRVSAAVQKERLLARGLAPEQIARRIASQYNFETKKQRIDQAIDETGQGKLWLIDNTAPVSEATISQLFEELLHYSKISIPQK